MPKPKTITKRDSRTEILEFIANIERDALRAPNKSVQNYLQRWARDARIGEGIHFKTTR